MTVREVRTLRSLNKKCVAAEARSRLLEKLLSKGVGLKEMEEFILREERKKMGNRDKEGKGKGNNESNKKGFQWSREIVKKILKDKLKDNNLKCIQLRRDRRKSMGTVQGLLGKASETWSKLMTSIRRNGEKQKQKLTMKNDEKIERLVKKYKKVNNQGGNILTEEEEEKYGNARIFEEACKMMAEKEEGPVIVCEEGKILEISEEETSALALDPKFCIVKDLREEEFEVALEECISKLRWDKMGDEIKEKNQDPAMEAIDAVIDEEQREELRQHELQREGELTTVLLGNEKTGKGTWQYSKRKVTGYKGNSRVILPKRSKKFSD